MKKRLLCASTLACLLAACANARLTQENVSKLHIGMVDREVTALLGRPTACDSIVLVRQCIWQAGESSVTVHFVANKVVTYFANNLR